jgi:hypothetical protein
VSGAERIYMLPRMFRHAVAFCAVALVCAAPASAKSTKMTTVSATKLFRATAAEQFDGPVSLGDGRGCAYTTSDGAPEWICTAYIRKTNTDVYGTVGSGDIAEVRRAKGGQVTKWFLATDGGCQTNSCAGTNFHP